MSVETKGWGPVAPLAEIAGRSLSRALERLASIADQRTAFWATALGFVGLFWLSPRLPMVDLPQHAAQVVMLRDLLLSASAWPDLVEINLGTPYLVGYLLALPLTLVMSASHALAVVLSLSLAGMIAASVALREEAGADARLDWLFLPSFIGLAWKWGYYPFLVVAPLVLVMACLALRHAHRPSLRTAAKMVGAGILLLLGHGMAFLFGCLVAGMMLLVRAHSLRDLAVRLAPLGVLGGAFLLFLLASKGFDTPVGDVRFIWGFNPAERVLALFALSHGFTVELALMSAALLFVPWALGSKPNPSAAVPFAVLVVWVLAMPKDMLGAVHWGERFGMFTMPFFALLWCRRSTERSLRSNVAALALVAGCWASLGVMGLRLHQFARESADFEIVLAAAEPNKRALSIGSDNSSAAALHPFLYVQHAAWYAADKQGLVDYNFASLHNLIVRFRKERRPPLDVDFASHSHTVDWRLNRARDYDYYFVRHGTRPIPPQLLENGECRIDTVAAAGAWTLLARGTCRN